ncbi:MAG: hypothetical protein OEM02_01400 [Desulfobulbaceae bacterium]|nr:hypothetical protein [Desulfobulbaceae bacterium]
MSDNQENGEQLDSKLIPPLREAIDMVRMVLYDALRKDLEQRESDLSSSEIKLLAGAVVNSLFGTPNPEGEAAAFVVANRERVEDELRGVSERFPKYCGYLTDTLRMQVICDNQEGGNSLPSLLMARALGILKEERPLPMPSSFMITVRALGAQCGLLVPMSPSEPPTD